jgi:hypothetical protein
MSGRASQQSRMWARMRSSRRWNTGRRSRLLGLDLGLVEAQQALGCDAQEPVQAGLGRDHPAQLGAFGGRQPVSVVDQVGQLGDQPFADGGVPVGRFGVAADDEPVVGVDVDFLDLRWVAEASRGLRPRRCGPGSIRACRS